MKITKDDIGKRVWCTEREEYGIIFAFNKHYEFPVTVGFSNGGVLTFREDGVYDTTYGGISLSWTKPKKKVTRTVECWANVYELHTCIDCYLTKETADNSAGYGRIACVKLTGAYEVEVDDE